MIRRETDLWLVRSFNDGGVIYILQKASNTLRSVNRSTLSADVVLSSMSEGQFNSAARAAFHGWVKSRSGREEEV